MNGLWMLLGLAAAQAPAPTPHQSYAKGLELAKQEQRTASAREFESVRAMTLDAAQGELRRAAIYNLGTLELQEGELWRAKLPELQKNAPAAALPLPPTPVPGANGGGAKEEDPLEKARRHYTAARKHFIERLRIDWKDADTRANAEAYLAGPIVAGMKANPNVADLRFTLSDVRERMSAITHAPVPGLAPVQLAAE